MKFLSVTLFSLFFLLLTACVPETNKKCEKNQVLVNGTCVPQEQANKDIFPTPAPVPTLTPSPVPTAIPTAQPKLSCGSIPHNATESRIAYSAASVAFGQLCSAIGQNQTRTCNNGTWSSWSGSYQFLSCSVQTAAACGNITSGQYETRTRYQASSVEAGKTCVSEIQKRLCTNGTFGNWSGTNTNLTCSVQTALACGNTASGSFEMRTMYQSAAVNESQNCVSETQSRQCMNGTFKDWSGTYTQVKCVKSRIRYEAVSVPAGSSCSLETQKMSCENAVCGVWVPNNYSNISCSVISDTSTTTSITQYGITWKFSTPVKYGQFVSGDFWVIGPVTLSSVSPAPLSGNNGSMINPIPGGMQGLDSGAGRYDSSLSLTFPKVLNPGDALLSSISLDGSETGEWNGNSIGSNQHLRTVAVLTILPSIPPSGSFRPSYSDRKQTLYNISQIKTSILPNLAAPVLPSHKGFGTAEYFERGMQRPWILFGNDWQARGIHPVLNMSDYHEELGMFLSEATLFLATNIAGKTALIHKFVQLGIDYYHNGTADSSVWAWPVVLTGLLLDKPEMYNYWINNPGRRTQREHEKLYYPEEVTVSTTSAIIPKGKTWEEWTTAEGKYVAFRKQKGEEYEHLHPSEWICYAPHCKAEVYRAQHDIYPLIGLTLSSILVDKMTSADVNAMLAHNPLRDYCDRWMSNGFQTKQYRNTGRTYRQEMEYHTDFNIYNYRYGSGSSPFIDAMWKAYR